MKKTLLFLSVIATTFLNAQIVDCNELFFSEYIEGWSQNKAIEVYNPTNATVDLSDYRIERYSNGATNSSAGGITTLSGMLASGDAFVLTNGESDTTSTFGFCDPILLAMADFAEPNGSYPTPMHMNGNDAMVLTKNGLIIDVIGKVGEDPSSGAWTADAASGFTLGTWWTANHTLIRKSTVLKGDNNGLDLFDPSAEWDSLPAPNWSNLGSHTCDCQGTSAVDETNEISYIMYPNPANSGASVIINATEKIERIELINILGAKALTTNSNTIITSDLAKGTYIVNIQFSDGRQADNKLIVE
jgi:predicted extracellular nuclease